MTISRILIPMHFSVHSDAAFGYALELARTVNANIRVLHVVHRLLEAGMWSWSDEFDTADLDRLEANLERNAEKRLAQLVPWDAERVSTEVGTGDPTKQILDAARDHGADLIIMGTHGRTGVTHVVMGSVAERALRQARASPPVAGSHRDQRRPSGVGPRGTGRNLLVEETKQWVDSADSFEAASPLTS